MYFILLFIVGAYAECSYTHPDILWCKNIDTFNINRSNAVYLDIEETNLTRLPLFTREEWPRLEFLTLRNNTVLPCAEILKQQYIFYIDHDCVQQSSEYPPILPSEYTPVTKGAYHLPLASIAVFVLFISIIVICKKVKDHYR